MRIFEDYNYGGQFDKEIAQLLGEEFNEENPDYKLFGYLYDVAFVMEHKDPIWSAFRDNQVVVMPDGELNIYCKVCKDYLDVNGLFRAMIEKYQDNTAMICFLAETYEEFRYDKEDVPYSRICANLPEEIGMKVFNRPDYIVANKEMNQGGYYSYKVTAQWGRNFNEPKDKAIVYVKDIFKEYVLCSAEYYAKANGLITLGPRHHNCLHYMTNVTKEFGIHDNGETVVGGFYTSQGRFVNRYNEEEMTKLLENHLCVERTSENAYYSEDFLYTQYGEIMG